MARTGVRLVNRRMKKKKKLDRVWGRIEPQGKTTARRPWPRECMLPGRVVKKKETERRKKQERLGRKNQAGRVKGILNRPKKQPSTYMMKGKTPNFDSFKRGVFQWTLGDVSLGRKVGGWEGLDCLISKNMAGSDKGRVGCVREKSTSRGGEYKHSKLIKGSQ